ncbi:MAG: hypothetical protein DMD67_11640 [Gemmatimonadetes bacterium]|nr:MAG: hypothetical protein DMD67_11640 [Gemmatimonadota bacterium]
MVDQHEIRSQPERDVPQDLPADRAKVLFRRFFFLRATLERGGRNERRELDVVASLRQPEVARHRGLGRNVGDRVRISGEEVPGNR